MAGLPGLTIRSKLILMLLGVSIVALLVTATIGYISGRDSLEARVSDQLTSLRVAKADEVEQYIGNLRAHVGSLGSDLMVLDAVGDFADAYDSLEDRPLAPEADSLLRGFYSESFLPRLVTDGEPVLDAFVPEAPVARTLQTRYLAANPNPPGEKAALNADPSGDAYAQAHARYHAPLRRIVEEFGYYDLFLIDARGRIVYSVEKEVDFATSLTDGPYSTSNLSALFAETRRQKGARFVGISDFAFYQPSYGTPAAFIATPLFDGPRFAGALVVQLPIDRINAIASGDNQWAEGGLGQTGETLLVGPDDTLRSAARGFVEDSAAYASDLRAMGTDSRTLRRIRAHDTPILLQEATSAAVQEAQAGRSGTITIAENYRGDPALTSYAPLALNGLDWIILTEMSLAEAYAPIRRFERQVLITAAILSLLVTLLAMGFAGLFTRPIRALTDRAHRVRGGEDVPLATGTDDELGEMSTALDALVLSLRGTAEASEKRRTDTEMLLMRFLPDSLSYRLEQATAGGSDWDLSESVESATVVHATLGGYEEIMRLGPDALAEFLNDIVQAVDSARLRFGVEKVRAYSDSYIAACGLSTPHLDHVRRSVEFAVEVRAIVRRASVASGTSLNVRIGVATGTAFAGIIGGDKLTFDIWGPAPGRAAALNALAGSNEILVSDSVRDALGEARPLAQAGPNAWRVEAPPAGAAPAPLPETAPTPEAPPSLEVSPSPSHSPEADS